MMVLQHREAVMLFAFFATLFMSGVQVNLDSGDI
jgi:hypothetical protein